jgi:small subunit ribosomal protein S4e
MGSKGNSRHIKRLASPRYLHIEKKVNAYVVKPNAGRHLLESSIAIATVLKEKMSVASNAREARSILKSGSVEVNGKQVKDSRYPLGFGDVIRFKPTGEQYSIGVGSKGSVSVNKLEGKEHEQVFKVIGKYVARGGKEMIRLYNGNVVPSSKGISVNDTVRIKEGKVSDVMKLQKGARCLIIKGVHASESGVISEIKAGTALRRATVAIDGSSGRTETLLDNIMVVGGK